MRRKSAHQDELRAKNDTERIHNLRSLIALHSLWTSERRAREMHMRRLSHYESSSLFAAIRLGP
ncbi:MAG: hypothetical protein DMG99_03755 [Acidobacteria bacterium]|nr:MAG: hypothetical protein DMG99_03755 [Acidobacteriota bacterium]